MLTPAQRQKNYRNRLRLKKIQEILLELTQLTNKLNKLLKKENHVL